jgi:hypothetical protein
MNKTIFKEIFIIIVVFIFALPIFASLFRLDENQNMNITLFEAILSMSTIVAQLHIWLLLIFIIYSFRQLKLKFKNLIVNLILIIVCLKLIFMFKPHVINAENLLISIQNDGDSSIKEKMLKNINSFLIFNWSFIISFLIIGITTIWKSIIEIKSTYNK